MSDTPKDTGVTQMQGDVQAALQAYGMPRGRIDLIIELIGKGEGVLHAAEAAVKDEDLLIQAHGVIVQVETQVSEFCRVSVAQQPVLMSSQTFLSLGFLRGALSQARAMIGRDIDDLRGLRRIDGGA